MKSTPVDVMVKLSAEFDSPYEIAMAKKLLFERISAKCRCINRIGNERARGGVFDIIRVLFELDINAMLRALQELEAMKTSIKLLTNNQGDMLQLIQDRCGCMDISTNGTTPGMCMDNTAQDTSTQTDDQEELPQVDPDSVCSSSSNHLTNKVSRSETGTTTVTATDDIRLYETRSEEDYSIDTRIEQDILRVKVKDHMDKSIHSWSPLNDGRWHQPDLHERKADG